MFNNLSSFRLGSLIAAGAVVLAISSFSIMNLAIDRYVVKDAEEQALAWGTYLGEKLPYLEAIVKGLPPGDQSKAFIGNAAAIGNVFRFKLFDKQGRIQLISDELDINPRGAVSLKEHNPQAAKVVESGNAYTVVKEGTSPNRPPLYAETYIPILKYGKTIGIVEVYVDQTDAQALARSEFTLVAIALMALTFLSFGAPGIAFYYRSRQKLKADERIHFLAHNDALTGLLNRSSFTDAVTRFLNGKRKIDDIVALYYIDVDRFKEINDTLGHDIGDALITKIGERLFAASGRDDVVARLSGDEFAVAQPGVSSPNEAEVFAANVAKALSEPIVLDKHSVIVTVSIGVALSPHDGLTTTQLFKCADVALYRAKADGKNKYMRFTPEMNDLLHRRRMVEAALRLAAETDGFDLYFQPLFNIKGTKLTGFEALLRLDDCNAGRISPAEFIPIAEEMGLISQIGNWVLRRACNLATDWPEHLKVAVNLSPQQFRGEGIVGNVERALSDSGLDPSRLELEITEGLLMQDTDPVLQQLGELKEVGISIVMDDFGTGYSSLSYLWRFPFDKIKIDRSFMEAANHSDPGIRNILKTIVSLGHSLDMKVTAEGVETEDQAVLLQTLSCDHLQGFLFGRPVDQSEVAAVILNDFKDGVDVIEVDGSVDPQELKLVSNQSS